MTKSELVKRYLLFIISLFFMGLGVALTKHGELGVSPISSVANVISCKFTFLTFGNWLIISNCVLIAGQIILLRKNFQLIQLLQIPLSVIFGYFTDLGMWFAGAIPNNIYWVQLLLVFLGITVLGFGISLGVTANVILNSGEAFVKALSDVTKKDFGNTKVVFDISWVILSIIISLLLFDGRLVGTREGTVISAICVGLTVKFFKRRIHEPLTRIISSSNKEA